MGQPPADALLGRKSTLLGTLSFSLERIRAALANSMPTSAEMRQAVQRAQQTILKALLLDRENEQLLLKCTMQKRPVAVTPRPARSQVQRVYGRSTAH